MDFDPLDVLTAAELDDLVENDQALAAGTGLNDASVTPAKRTGGFYIGEITGATLGSTGNKAVTGVGFTPKMVRFTLRTPSAGTTSAINGTGGMTPTFQFFTINFSSATASRRTGSTTACIGWTDDTTTQLSCSYVSMDADGFTINVATASSIFPVVYEAHG